MSDRYKSVEGSILGHGCCFGATVVDSTLDKDHEDYVICECHELETAEKIARALNKEKG